MKKIVEGLKELLTTMDNMETDKICEKMKQIEDEATYALYASNSDLFDKDCVYQFICDIMRSLRRSISNYNIINSHNPIPDPRTVLRTIADPTKENPFDALQDKLYSFNNVVIMDFKDAVKEIIGTSLKIITRFALDKDDGYNYIFIDQIQQKEIECLTKLFAKIKISFNRIAEEIRSQTGAYPFDIEELIRSMVNLTNGESRDFWRNMIFGYLRIFLNNG